MAREIPEYLERCAADLGTNAAGWGIPAHPANALFLRGFDREILEEMRGIADGASDAGAKWQGRRIDLIDIVVANVTVETGRAAQRHDRDSHRTRRTQVRTAGYYDKKHDSVLDHCSAFAATGPATRDGKMMIGHVTWWPLTLAEQTNVMLDIKPENGHRMLMQSYPGGIESGTDWYQNDAGVVLTETTIRQTPFNAQGTPVAFRARMAIQYGGNIDEVVKQLGTRNNGLYTNEWLIGDAKNNEIAMYELGTAHTKLWRSSKNEWFGRYARLLLGQQQRQGPDHSHRSICPIPKARPSIFPTSPDPRSGLAGSYTASTAARSTSSSPFWRSAPRRWSAPPPWTPRSSPRDMAITMMVWAEIGKPNQREWLPGGRSTYEKNDGLYPSGYALFTTTPPSHLAEIEQARLNPKSESAQAPAPRTARPAANAFRDRLWKGWIIPASDSDTWFAAGTTAYHELLQSDDLEKALDARRIQYRGLKLAPDNAMNRFRIEETKGVLYLDSLRRKLGDDKFFPLLSNWFAENTTKTVSAQSFLNKAGVAYDFTEPADGPAYAVSDIGRRLATAVLVYGTQREAGANRYAAEQLQAQYLNQFESQVPIYKDFEVNDDLLAHKDVIFVGRPEANTALAAWAKQINLDYQAAIFKIDNQTHAGEREALTYAAKNPQDPSHMVLVLAGNDALRTVKLATAGSSRFEQTPYVITGESRAAAPASPAGRRAR